MQKLIARFLADERGATSIEYALIAAGVSITIVVLVNGIGSNMKSRYVAVNNSLK